MVPLVVMTRVLLAVPCTACGGGGRELVTPGACVDGPEKGGCCGMWKREPGNGLSWREWCGCGRPVDPGSCVVHEGTDAGNGVRYRASLPFPPSRGEEARGAIGAWLIC
ncbi:hypothetical protein DFH08DRAFT_873907 [Mycena albidolilacea]|uniref:Secreted protein n=1 Tax=Mycena albidolilacea TaxID=1033008 RepID=A0AAD7EPR0_9AGAR|nr:hypothetical protein DFH08DRAFT_873907 [Mycena albidolilacea]